MPQNEIYDIAIIGAGPAGLSATLYAGRDRHKTILLEKAGIPGGQILLTERIENFPGYETISGFELISKMQKQVESLGVEITTSSQVTALHRRNEQDSVFEIQVNNGEKVYLARTVILSSGSDYRKLGVPGEDLMRKATRVSYCATCDGAFYKDKTVLTVGGGNTAVEDTIYLAERFAKKTILIHRRKEFRAEKVLVDELYQKAKEHNIEIKLPYVLVEIVPTADKNEIDHVVIENVETSKREKIHVDGVFIFAGMTPNTAWLKETVKLDESGYIICDPATLQTTLPGVFVAGDCRIGAPMQLITACADGVVAALMIRDYLKNPATWQQAAKRIPAREPLTTPPCNEW